jgi:hypothetical protein
MISECKRPTLIVEGAGDTRAIPRLIRETLHSHLIYDINPVPRAIHNVEIRRLIRSGELERYIEYAVRNVGDSVLLILDCEDFCPLEICQHFCFRIAALCPRKKVGIVLFQSEFETLFLHCIDEIAAHFPDYGWISQRFLHRDIETIRDAKGTLSRMMRNDRAYKETRDQEKFITALNFDKLRGNSRPFRHFESTLLWLSRGTELIYPVFK